PGFPHPALAVPGPAQSRVSDTMAIWLYPRRTSFMTDGLKTWLQLNPRLRNGACCRRASKGGIARWSVFESYSANEKRAKALSFGEAFQSRRRSPWWTRTRVSASPTKLRLTPPTARLGKGYSEVSPRIARAIGLMRLGG